MSQFIIKVANNTEIAEKKLHELRIKMEEIKKVRIQDKIKELIKENSYLLAEVDNAKAKLIKLETLNGKKQYSVPGKVVSESQIPCGENTSELELPPVSKKEKKVNDLVKNQKEKSKDAQNDSVVDVRKLDFRIGKIVEIAKHPDADTLYVEKIDCGEDKPRTVVSGLVNYVPIEEMKDRMVMVLCNLKPVKMRGVTSEAMVMCASAPNKVEVLIPPSGAKPGDLVKCDNYPREPEIQLNPKKKIFETCAPDLKTNDDKLACYKGNPLIVPGKGPVTAATLAGVQVK